MSERAMPTMGPVHVLCLSIGQHGHEVRVAPNGRIIARLPRSGEWRKADADLIAAAFNAATEARAMGFDPIGAVQALPKLLNVLAAAQTSATRQPRTTSMWVLGWGVMRGIDSALDAARTRKETP